MTRLRKITKTGFWSIDIVNRSNEAVDRSIEVVNRPIDKRRGFKMSKCFWSSEMFNRSIEEISRAIEVIDRSDDGFNRQTEKG